jgi:hypothetical protein
MMIFVFPVQKEYSFGGKPKPNSRTFTFISLAVKKCPNS